MTIFGRDTIIWINKLSEGANNLNIEKIAYKDVHKLSFDMFMVEYLQNILMDHDP